MWCLDARTGQGVYGQQRIKPGTYSSCDASQRQDLCNERGWIDDCREAGAKFEVIAENALNDYCLSSPAISDGQIFIRTAGQLFCIGNISRASGEE